MTDKNIDQSGQTIEGSQINASGDFNVDHLGDNIVTSGGDYVAGDQTINYYVETKTIISIKSLQEIEQLDPTPGDPPFKGLAYFSEDDADNFFGREKLSKQLVTRLHSSRFLAVIGASGSGKSSLIRAGIVPTLRRQNWLINIMTPSAHPLDQLATSLTRDELSLTAADSLSKELTINSRTLHLAANKLASRKNVGHLLLVVDQFEEVFTLCQDEKERQAFLDNLITAYQAQGAVTVLIGLRADFFHHTLQYESLRTILSQHQELIGPMKQEDLVRIIAEPARRGSWHFVEGLVEQFLDDVGQEPGRLPLLSHALLETWQRRRGTVMTLSGYQETGGIEKAIANTADETMESLSTAQASLAKKIFLALTEIGDGELYTRRVVSYYELTEKSDEKEQLDLTLERLVNARLITIDSDQIEVAHEALLRRWPRLLEWLDNNREQLLLERKLQRDVAEWDSHNRDPNFLYRGTQLKEALKWRTENKSKLGAKEEGFLNRSHKRYRRQLYLSRTLRASAILLLLFLGTIIFREFRQAISDWKALNNSQEYSIMSMTVVNTKKPRLCIGTGSEGVMCNGSSDNIEYIYNDGGWSGTFEHGIEADEISLVENILGRILIGSSESDRSRSVDFVEADEANPGDIYALDRNLNAFTLNLDKSTEWQPITTNLLRKHCIDEMNDSRNHKFDVHDAIVVIACFDDPTKQSYLHIGQVDSGNWVWTPLTYPDSLPAHIVTGVHVGRNDSKVYIGTDEGLFRYDTSSPDKWEPLLDLPYIRLIEPNPLSTDFLFLATFDIELGLGSLQQWHIGTTNPLPLLEGYRDRPLAITAIPVSDQGWSIFMLYNNGDVTSIKPDRSSKNIEHYPSNYVFGGSSSLLAIRPSGTAQPQLFLGHTDGLFELK